MGDSPAYVVRDSAGAQIVESTRPAWNATSAWHVGDTALVRIGEVDGEPALQFSGIAGATPGGAGFRGGAR